MSIIGSVSGRRVEPPEDSLSGDSIKPPATTMVGDPRAGRAAAAERRAEELRERDETRARELEEFRAAQSVVDLSYFDLVDDGPRLTLAGAHDVLVRLGGSVSARDGELAFRLPRQLAPTRQVERRLRQEGNHAIRVLLAGRSTVIHCIRDRKALPDLEPGAGGSVVEP